MVSKLPQGWVECVLGDVLYLQNGYAFNSKDYCDNGICVIRISDIQNNKVNTKNAVKYNKMDIGKCYIVENGDFLLAMSGATTGKTGVYCEKSPAYLNQRVGNLKIYSQKVLCQKYRNYYIMYKRFAIEKKAYGGAQPNISKQMIESLRLLLPPLNEQRRIVEKIEEEFGKIDEGVEKLRFALEQIKQYRQAVLKSAFDGKLYKTTEWEEKTLGQILTPRRERITPNKHNGELPFIGMDCIIPNSLKIHNSYKLKDTKSVAFVFYKNDVLYGRMRSYLNKVWQATFDGASSAEFIVFPENKQITSGFLKYLLHQQTFVKYATRNASGDRPRVKFEADLAEYKIKLPKIDEQNLIVEKIENAFSIVEDLNKIIRQNLDKAEQLKQSILKKAFEGRLVPQDPNDEPASVLLEKIKAERKNK